MKEARLMNIYMIIVFLLCLWRFALNMKVAWKEKKKLNFKPPHSQRRLFNLYNNYCRNTSLMSLWLVVAILAMLVCRFLPVGVAIPFSLTIFMTATIESRYICIDWIQEEYK